MVGEDPLRVTLARETRTILRVNCRTSIIQSLRSTRPICSRIVIWEIVYRMRTWWLRADSPITGKTSVASLFQQRSRTIRLHYSPWLKAKRAISRQNFQVCLLSLNNPSGHMTYVRDQPYFLSFTIVIESLSWNCKQIDSSVYSRKW